MKLSTLSEFFKKQSLYKVTIHEPKGKSCTIDSIEEKVLSAKQKLTKFSLNFIILFMFFVIKI